MTHRHLFPSPDTDARCAICGERADARDVPFTEAVATARYLAGVVGSSLASPPASGGPTGPAGSWPDNAA